MRIIDELAIDEAQKLIKRLPFYLSDAEKGPILRLIIEGYRQGFRRSRQMVVRYFGDRQNSAGSISDIGELEMEDIRQIDSKELLE